MNGPLLSIKGLTKSYGDITILRGIDMQVGRNEIVGIAGENGAGKSTALKVLSGVVERTGGTMELYGQPYTPANYQEAVSRGVSMVFQEQALIGNLRIYENIYYGFEDRYRRFGALLDHGKMLRDARTNLERLGFGQVDASALTDDLPFHLRQMAEIARAFILAEIFGIAHPIILLDEPTAAIGEEEAHILFEAVRRLQEKASFVIVTHKLSEYIAICDRLYVLKDGELAGELSRDQMNEAEVHRLMVGRVRDQEFYHEDRQLLQVGKPRLEVNGLNGRAIRNVSLRIGAGEVVGLGGLVGCGKEEVVRAIVGHNPFVQSGEVVLNGQTLPVKGRLRATHTLGLGYVPKERKTEGIVSYMSVAENVSLASLDRVSSIPGVISPKKEMSQARSFIQKLGIRTRGPSQSAVYLSGGNQQKLVLAKWLARDVSVLVLDNPTRGVDVGAKTEIYRTIRDLADSGVSVLLVTDDLLELIWLSNRIIVMRDGQITAELEAPAVAKPTEHDIVRYMT